MKSGGYTLYPFHAWYKLPCSPIDVLSLRESCKNFVYMSSNSKISLSFYENDFGHWFPGASVFFPQVPVTIDVHENGLASILCMSSEQQELLQKFFESTMSPRLAKGEQAPICSCNFCVFAFSVDSTSGHVTPPHATNSNLPTLPAFLLFIQIMLSKLLYLLCDRFPETYGALNNATIGKSALPFKHPLFQCEALRIVSYRSTFYTPDTIRAINSDCIFLRMTIRTSFNEMHKFGYHECSTGDMQLKDYSVCIREKLRDDFCVEAGSIEYDEENGLMHFIVKPFVRRAVHKKREIDHGFNIVIVSPCEIFAQKNDVLECLPTCLSKAESYPAKDMHPLCPVYFHVAHSVQVTSRCPHALLHGIHYMCNQVENGNF